MITASFQITCKEKECLVYSSKPQTSIKIKTPYGPYPYGVDAETEPEHSLAHQKECNVIWQEPFTFHLTCVSFAKNILPLQRLW